MLLGEFLSFRHSNVAFSLFFGKFGEKLLVISCITIRFLMKFLERTVLFNALYVVFFYGITWELWDNFRKNLVNGRVT